MKGNVAVRRIEALRESAGGIIIPDVAREKRREGVVVAVGPEQKDVAVGERVMFDPYQAQDIKVHGEPLVLVKPEGLLAVVSQ